MAKYKRCPHCGNEEGGATLWTCENNHIFCDSCKVGSFIPLVSSCPECDESVRHFGQLEENDEEE